MPRIQLNDVIEDMAAAGWSVSSTEYANLDTEMEFKCPEGHMVRAPYKRIRERKECPVCKANHHKENKPIIIEKKRGVRRTLALDQATKVTGWSVFDGKELIKYGTFEVEGEEIERISKVREWLLSMIENWQPDIVGIEGIQYEQNFGVTTFQTLARLQGVLMTTCYDQGLQFDVCSTNTWRAHCGVKGRTRADKKNSMKKLVKTWFDISVTDDAADAIGIGKYVSESFAKKTEVVIWE